MKNKLPFLNKGKSEIDDESDEKTGLTEIADLESEDDELSEEASEDKSFSGKLKAKLASLNKKKQQKKNEVDDEDEDEDDEELSGEEKKKKNSKYIRIAIVGALLVFLASDYIFPPDEVAPAPEVPPKSKRVKTPKVEEVPATEPVTPAIEEPTNEPTNEPTTEPSLEPDLEPEPVKPDPAKPEPVKPEQDSGTTTYTPDDSPVDISSSSDDSSDTIFGESNTPEDVGPSDVTSSGDFTDQILQDLEKQANPIEEKPVVKKYVAPPDYDFRGRGLVYNCQGKHWACVDAPSYKICEDNSSSTKFLNKQTECYPFNVYETVRGCEITQNRMVSSSAKTKFCNE